MGNTNLDRIQQLSLLPDNAETLETVTTAIRQAASDMCSMLVFLYENRTWRHKYKSWADYCRNEFGWSATECQDKIMDAKQISSGSSIKSPLDCPLDEDIKEEVEQAFEDIVFVPEESQVAPAGENVVVAKRKKRPKPPNLITSEDIEPESDDPPPPKLTQPIVDALGNPVPDRLHNVFKNHDLKANLHKLLEVLQWVRVMATDPLWYHIGQSPAMDHLTAARRWIMSTSPHCLCPQCSGHPGIMCAVCNATGWITRQQLAEFKKSSQVQGIAHDSSS